MHFTNLKFQKISNHLCYGILSKKGIVIKVCAVLALTLLLSLSIFAQDQIKKGTYALGGSVGFFSTVSHQNGSDIDETDFVFSPNISYFFINNLELALSPYYGTSSSSGFSHKSLGIGMGFRYYFSAKNISPFLGANVESNWSALNGSSYSSPNSSGTLEGGLEVFISNSAAVEPTVTYFSERLGDQFTVSGFRIGVGIKYFIVP